MKKTHLITVLLLGMMSCFAQQPSVAKVDADMRAIKHKVPVTTKEGTFYKDSSYTVLVVLRLKDAASMNNIHINLGSEKGDSKQLNKNVLLKYHGSNHETLFAHDAASGDEMGIVKMGFLQLIYETHNKNAAKWLTVSIKNDTYESEKQYYEFK